MQILHKAAFVASAGLPHMARPRSRNEIIRKRLRSASNFVALKMRFNRSMKSYIHDMVSRLLELHALEERLATFEKSREDTSDVRALIESLRANVPFPILIWHDRLRARGTRSVAEVRHGVCSGCHLGLAVGNVNALGTGGMQRCGNCGRYLYFVEEESEPAPPPTAAKTHRKALKESTATPGAK
jgi:predicted  nucleic acid-binding Zn-ribbon protein